MITRQETAVVGASGTARVETGPSHYVESWNIKRVNVKCTVPSPMPVATILLGTGSIDATYTGAQDTTDLDLPLLSGQRIACEWVGAAAGSTVTLTILYDQHIRGRDS